MTTVETKETVPKCSAEYNKLPNSLLDFTDGDELNEQICPCAKHLLKIGFLAFGLLFLFMPLNFVACLFSLFWLHCRYDAAPRSYAGLWISVAFASRILLLLKTKRFYPKDNDSWSYFFVAVFLDISVIICNTVASLSVYYYDLTYWLLYVGCSVAMVFMTITTTLIWIIVVVVLIFVISINKHHLRHLFIPEVREILHRCYEICKDEIRHSTSVRSSPLRNGSVSARDSMWGI